MNLSVTTYSGIIFDLDGVIYSGKTLLPGAAALIRQLQSAKTPFLFLTNNSSQTPSQILTKFNQFGLSGINEQQILTSAVAVGIWFKKNISLNKKVLVFGMDGLREQVESLGYPITTETDADIVLAGLNRDVTYEQLSIASLALQAGAMLVASNNDRTFPTERGLLPGAGSLIKALTHSSQVEPTIVLGKPAKEYFELALSILQTDAKQTLMIGDRLDTDIVGAQQIGMPTALVLSGVSKREDLQNSNIQPDFIIESLLELVIANTLK